MKKAVQALLADVVVTFDRFRNRDLADQRALLGLIAREVGCEGILPPQVATDANEISPDDDVLDFFRNKTIGIYTLTEDVARRAKTLLESKYGGVGLRVEVDSSKGGNERLKNMENFDIVVVVWKSAKHAATEYIEKHRQRIYLC